MQGPDGRWFQSVNQPLAHGGWVATIEDITERRRLEQERDRNYAFLSQIIDHIPSQITVKDVHDRRYVLVNRVAETQFGSPRERHRRQDRPDDLSESLRRDHRGRRRQDAAVPRRPVQGRASLGKQGAGRRFITSSRIGIRDNAGERATSSTSSTTSPSAAAPTSGSRISRITIR